MLTVTAHRVKQISVSARQTLYWFISFGGNNGKIKDKIFHIVEINLCCFLLNILHSCSHQHPCFSFCQLETVLPFQVYENPFWRPSMHLPGKAPTMHFQSVNPADGIQKHQTEKNTMQSDGWRANSSSLTNRCGLSVNEINKLATCLDLFNKLGQRFHLVLSGEKNSPLKASVSPSSEKGW